MRVRQELNLKRKKLGLHPHPWMHRLRQTAIGIDGLELKLWVLTIQKNIAASLREGYELVKADEYPDEDFPTMSEGKYAGVIGVGGLLLARIPEEIALQIDAYYKKQNDAKEEAVENNLMKEQHPSMKFQKESNTRVTFGGTKK